MSCAYIHNHGMSCHVMSCHVRAWLVIADHHVIACHVMWITMSTCNSVYIVVWLRCECHSLSCHSISSCHSMPCNVNGNEHEGIHFTSSCGSGYWIVNLIIAGGEPDGAHTCRCHQGWQTATRGGQRHQEWQGETETGRTIQILSFMNSWYI